MPNLFELPEPEGGWDAAQAIVRPRPFAGWVIDGCLDANVEVPDARSLTPGKFATIDTSDQDKQAPLFEIGTEPCS